MTRAERMAERLRVASAVPASRVATRPRRAALAQRRALKRRRSEIKLMRRRVEDE